MENINKDALNDFITKYNEKNSVTIEDSHESLWGKEIPDLVEIKPDIKNNKIWGAIKWNMDT